MHADYLFLPGLFLVLVLGCKPDSETAEVQQRVNKSADVQRNDESADGSDAKSTTIMNQVVEASCGQCQFAMNGDGCDLAVRINGQGYYVDGSHIDDHGDAHGEAGLCNCVRMARVTGKIQGGRFVATAFEVLPETVDRHPENQTGTNQPDPDNK